MVVTNRAKWLILVAVIVIGIVVYSLFDPAGSVLFPKCPFRLLTGWDCPGCGSQRTIHALLHGNIGEGFSHNPLLVLSFPYLGSIVYLEYFNGKFRSPRLRQALMGRTACVVIFCVIMAYWIGRNIF